MSAATSAGSHAFFLDTGARGQRLCVLHAPAARADGAGAPLARVLLLPPFAEEMNKSRRMIALAARAFAAAGAEVLVMDLLGCGDSSGDFGDASWDDWVDDLRLGADWLRRRAAADGNGNQDRVGPAGHDTGHDAGHDAGHAPLWLWGLRAGALFVPPLLAHLADTNTDTDIRGTSTARLLFWQPVTQGKLQLQQFLRLRVAADLIGGQAKGAVQALRDTLAGGASVEIAGYDLSAALAQGLEAAQLKPCDGVERVIWLETATREDATLAPAASNAVEAWRARGAAVDAAVVRGPSFWASTEIEEAPRLIEASVAALRGRALEAVVSAHDSTDAKAVHA